MTVTEAGAAAGPSGTLRRTADRASATFRLARSLVTARMSPDARRWSRRRAAYYRELWLDAARVAGVEARILPSSAVQLGRDEAVVQVRETYCSIESREAMRRAGDKVGAAQLLVAAGLPVPPHRVVTLRTIDDARTFVASAPGPCVIKPAVDTGGGTGVTTNVRTPQDLRRAAVAAAAVGSRAGRRGSGPLARLWARFGAVGTALLLVEHQVPGVNYRLLYLDGVLIDAIRRDVPTVVGDGRRTVRALIDGTNRIRMSATDNRGERLVTRDLDLEQTLASQGLRWNSVPAFGRAVQLKTTINENAPVGNTSARAELCPALVEQGRRAAAAVGVRLAGVDIITDDPGVPLEDSGGCVLEVNSTPGLAMHYHGNPGAVPVAAAILAHLFPCAGSGAGAPAQPHRTSCG